MTFNKYSIKPVIPATYQYDSYGLMLKDKLDLLNNYNNLLNFSVSWYKTSRNINIGRNKNTHGDTYLIPAQKFILNPSSINSSTSVMFFEDVLNLVSLGIRQIKAN